MGVDRKPHIGEYDAKTNGFCGLSQNDPRPERAAKTVFGDASARGDYCPWLTRT